MAGYTRQDTTDNIANGNIIDADDLDSEFNAVDDAFNSTTGHSHDGTAGEGARITAAGPAGEMTVTATAIQPASDNALDLGTSSVEMKDGFFDGTIKTDELIVDETSTFTGAVTTSAAVSVGTTLTVASDLTVDGTTLHVDSTNNRVGLGLTNPGCELHVFGSTPQVRLQVTGDTQNNRIEFCNSAGVIQSRIMSGGVNGQTIQLDGNVDVTNSLSVSGTVDGRDVAADGTKLDGIEANATADQTAAEIRTLVGSATDSNVFTDADHSKLNGIEASATADQTAAEILTAIKTVDGASSGLDADTVDGIEASSFLRSDASDSFSGTITNSGTFVSYHDSNSPTTNLQLGRDSSQYYTFHGGSTGNFLTSVSSSGNPKASLKFGYSVDGGASHASIYTLDGSSGTLWHSGNDGASSGLDADTVDGIEASAFLQTSGGTMTGAISTNSTFDGRDVAADGTKLDGIEANATADQTAAEIRALVETASDSNVFTDADHSKLNGIENNATADQSASEIRALVESATDSNVFTDADHSKLNGIATSADVTDTTNVTAAGALMDAECSSVSSLKAINQALTTTSSPTFSSATVSGNINLSGDILNSSGGTVFKADNAPFMRDHDFDGRVGLEANGTGYTQRIGATGTQILWKWSKGTSGSPTVMGKFDADGELTCVSTNITSDERVKSNIVDANSQWSDIKDLRLCNYTMNDSGQTHLGVIAQEAQVVSPGMVRDVSEDRDGSLLGINTSALLMKMLGALQESMARIEELEAKAG